MRIALFLLAILICNKAVSQQSKTVFNHSALLVKNFDTSVSFYSDLFNLDTIPYPFIPNEQRKIKWFDLKGGQLHLVWKAKDTAKYNSPTHLGLSVRSIDGVLQKLPLCNHLYRSGKEKIPAIERMPDGSKTVFIKDPEENWIHLIEVNNR